MRDPNLVQWNEDFKALRQALKHPVETPEWRTLFLGLHAAVHRAEVSQMEKWSRADEVLSGLTAEGARRVPPGSEHSVTWVLWHLARIEDVTMNVLLAGQNQLFLCDRWQARLNTPVIDTGNGSQLEYCQQLSQAVSFEALLEYRDAVGRSTRKILQEFPAELLCKRVDPARLQRLADEGAVTPAGKGALDYWGSLTLAGLLLMPPTRHNFLHLNEIRLIRKKLHV